MPGWGGGSRRATPGGLGLRPQADSSQEIYGITGLGPTRSLAVEHLAGFSHPRNPKISRDRESDSALRPSLPGGTTEIPSPQTGLVLASAKGRGGSASLCGGKAVATERRKAREKFCQFTFKKVGITSLDLAPLETRLASWHDE